MPRLSGPPATADRSRRAPGESRAWHVGWALVLLLALAWRVSGLHDDLLYDSLSYAQYAYNMLQGTFSLRDDYVMAHRLPLIVPTAGAYAVFGVNSVSSILWPLLLSLVQIGFVMALGVRLFDRSTGLLAGLFLALLPMDAIHARMLLPDVVMAAFSTGAVGFWLLGTERLEQPRRGLLVLAGACCVVAVLARVYMAVLAVSLLAHLLWRRIPVRAALWAALGALAVALPVAVLYLVQAGNALHPLLVQFQTYSERFKPRSLEPLFYPRHLWSPRSHAGPFGLLFMGSAVVALLRPSRPRWVLFIWILPLFLYLQYGSMGLTSYRPVFKDARYIMPLCAPLALLAASVALDAVRSRWAEGAARRLALPAGVARAFLLAFLIGVLAAGSWLVMSADRAGHRRVSESFASAVQVLERDPSLPIYFDHWRTGLAFSYYFRFRQGADFYHGGEDSLRIRRPGGFGNSRFGYLPWYADSSRVPRGFVVLSDEVLGDAVRRSGAPAHPYLGVRMPEYCFAPPSSWRLLLRADQLRVFSNPAGGPPGAAGTPVSSRRR